MRPFSLIYMLTCGTLLSTEIDSFTLRDPFMEDSTQELNRIIQRYFDSALNKANRSKSCNPQIIEKAFHEQTGVGLFWAQVEQDIEKSDKLDRRNIAVSKSIYRDVLFSEGWALHLASLGFLMKVGNLYIGSDKLGHFLDQGYDYYQYATLNEALDFGHMTEETYYGLTSTGVYSYGDLSANFDGYLFWSELTRGKNPYFVCSDNQWRQQRTFDWTNHITPAWDEGLNCSRYVNLHVTLAVHQRIAGLNLSCPIDPRYCSEMIEHYGSYARRLVTPECFKEPNV